MKLVLWYFLFQVTLRQLAFEAEYGNWASANPPWSYWCIDDNAWVKMCTHETCNVQTENSHQLITNRCKAPQPHVGMIILITIIIMTTIIIILVITTITISTTLS